MFWNGITHRWQYRAEHKRRDPVQQKQQIKKKHPPKYSSKGTKGSKAQAEHEAQLKAKAKREAVAKAPLKTPQTLMGKGLLPPPEKKARPLKKGSQGIDPGVGAESSKTLKRQLGLQNKGWNKYNPDSEWYKTGPGAGKYVWDTSRTPPSWMLQTSDRKAQALRLANLKLHPPKKKKGDPGTGPLPVKKHHVVVPDPVVTHKIEHQPTWVHTHPGTSYEPLPSYTFKSAKWNTSAVAASRCAHAAWRCRGTRRTPTWSGRPHTDPGPEAPLSQAVLTI